MLAALVAKLRGRPWTEVAQAEVLNPLGLVRTSETPSAPHANGWAVHPWADLLLPEPFHDAGLMSPAGGFWSTAEDLARLAVFLHSGACEVLSAETLYEMREPAAPGSDAGNETTYGLGLQLTWSAGRMLYGHCGSVPGFISGFWVNDDGVAAVALANATSDYPIGALASDLMDLVGEHEPAIPPVWRPLSAVSPNVLSLTGTWYWGPIPHVLRLLPHDELSLTPVSGDDVPARFRPEAKGTWTGRNGYHACETLRPVTRSDGTVTHLELGALILTRQPYDESAPIPGGVDPAGWRAG